MLGIDERALRVVWTVFLFSLLLAVVWLTRDTLMIFALAIFFAYMLTPIVGLVERLIPKRRNLALAVVYCLLVGLIVFIGFQLVPAIGSQANSLATRLPHLLTSDKIASLPMPGFLRPYQAQVVAALSAQIGTVQSHVLPVLQQAGTRILTGLGALLPAILIPILAFFFLKDGENISISLIGAVEDGHDRTLMQQVLEDVHVVLKSYIRALVLLSIAAFVVWVVFLTVMRYPYELLLAGCAAVGEFIPVIGPLAALAVMVIACAVTGSGGILWLIVFWGLYRMFADYVLNPYLMSSGVELHPLLVLLGVLAGERLGGVPGMFFSIPVIAILRVIFINLRKTYSHRRFSPGAPIPRTVAITPGP